jgi:4-hydroxy-tetrahydrodipicolinate reductase
VHVNKASGAVTSLRVTLAGATGWAGSELARGIGRTSDLALVAAIARKHAGHVLGKVLGEPRLGCRVYPSATEALAEPCDVFVEYTKPDSAKRNILAALEHGAHGVVGTSGLAESDFADPS